MFCCLLVAAAAALLLASAVCRSLALPFQTGTNPGCCCNPPGLVSPSTPIPIPTHTPFPPSQFSPQAPKKHEKLGRRHTLVPGFSLAFFLVLGYGAVQARSSLSSTYSFAVPRTRALKPWHVQVQFNKQKGPRHFRRSPDASPRAQPSNRPAHPYHISDSPKPSLSLA